MNNPNCGKCGMLSNTGYCKLTACIYPCQSGMGGYINKPVTNADRIRMMTDEELAKLFGSIEHKPWMRCEQCRWESCEECFFDWLKQEATDDL